MLAGAFLSGIGAVGGRNSMLSCFAARTAAGGAFETALLWGTAYSRHQMVVAWRAHPACQPQLPEGSVGTGLQRGWLITSGLQVIV